MPRGVGLGGVVLSASLVCVPLFAQNSTITGQITDQTQAAIPNVRITIAAPDTGQEYKTTTDGDGVFVYAGLPPGTYVVTAEMDGFKKKVSVPFQLEAGGKQRIDLALLAADTRQTIEVTAEPAALQTESGMVGSTITSLELDSLPFASRNAMEAVMTVPGVAGELGEDESGVFVRVPTAGAGLSIGGGRPGGGAILTDGASISTIGIGGAAMSFSPDTIQEFQVITNAFSATMGVTGSGVIRKVLRGGDNRLSGNFMWLHQNPVLASRQFNRPIPPDNRRHNFGLYAGGPVVVPKIYDGRNKTFFFVAIEPKRWMDTIEIYERFPTLEERQGDFRNMYVQPGQTPPLLYQQVQCFPSEIDCKQVRPMHRPSGTAEYPLWSTNDPDPSKRGRVIPKAYLDPISQLLLQDVPLPNLPFDANGRNYFGVRGVTGAEDRWNVKIDHNFTKQNRLTGRYTHAPNLADRYKYNRENLFFAFPSDRRLARQVQLTDAHVFSPRVVNELRASYTFGDFSRTAPGEIATINFVKDRFGLPNQTNWGYPDFRSGWGVYGFDLGNPLGTYIEHNYQVSDDLTIIRGRHSMTIGADWRFMQLNIKSSELRWLCCGQYNFAAAQTNSGNTNTPGGTGGLQFASFLLGVPNGINLRSIIVPYYYRWRTGAAYFQDDWKVRPNLTLNLGVRWQYNSPRLEKFNRQASIDLQNPVQLLNPDGSVRAITFNYVYAGFDGQSRYLEPAHQVNFEPRFGFAWSPKFLWNRSKRRVVIRGGYGISHLPNTGRGRDPVPDFGAGTAGTWGYTRWQNNNRPALTQSENPDYLISIGRNKPVVRYNPAVLEIPKDGILCHACPPRDARVPTGESFSAIMFSKTNSPPYMQNWNLTTEFELPGKYILSFSYLGSKGTHLYSPVIGINHPDPQLFEEMLNNGEDPNELVEDPFGRANANGAVLTVRKVDLIRPYPTAGDINLAGLTNSNSVYHAGAVSLERRFSGGGAGVIRSLRANYTWGKSIDTTSDSNLTGANLFSWGAPRVQDPEDLTGNRAVSLFDTRHRINLTMVADLPFGHRRRFLNHPRRLSGFLVNYWQFNMVSSVFSGFPFAPFLGDANGVPGGATGTQRIRPDLAPGVPIKNPRWSKSVANDVPYFNPEAFARPKYGNLGDAPRTLDWARAPWKQTLNVSLFKEFQPFENPRRKFQFRAEFFNVLNHATFQTDNTVLNLFGTGVPVSRTGLQLDGPIPYLWNARAVDFPIGSRERILAQNYNQNFGKLWWARNGPGRVVQLGLRFYF